MSEIAQTEFNDKTNIKVVGVGGAGGNAVNRMIAEGLQNVEFVAVNTDAKDLMRSDADVKISLSDKSSRGLGAGADPERGAKAAQDHQSDIEESLKGADMVFVTCGEGGGTGTGASPIVARAAHQQGALTIAVVTRPFGFEGPQRAASADYGIDNLRKEVDALIVIPNDRLLELSDRSIGIIEPHVYQPGEHPRRYRAACRCAGHHRPHLDEFLHSRGFLRRELHPPWCRHRAVRYRFRAGRGSRHSGRRDRHQLPTARREHRGCTWCIDQHRRPD